MFIIILKLAKIVTSINVVHFMIIVFVYFIHYIRKKYQHYLVHNFNELKRIVVIFGKQCPESNTKQIVQPLSASSI